MSIRKLGRKILRYLVIFEILTMSFTQELGNDAPFRLIPGIYTEELPLPIFYETYAPIILKYQLPNWNKSEVTFNNWYTCISETAPFRYTCPVVFHMNKAILNLHIDFESIQPVQDTKPHGEFYSKLFANSEFCDLIRKHFSGIYIQSIELNTYIQTLEKCHLSTSAAFTDLFIDRYNFSIRHPFTKIENNFYNTFYKNINSTLDLVASATLSNARATIQATLLSAYYAEKYRWSHAVQDCRAQVIPNSVVTYSKFNESLVQLSSLLPSVPSARPPLELSVPLELISKYYNLPITDCTFTEDAFVTRILIPVRNKNSKVSNLKLVKLNVIPFRYKNKLCQVQIDKENEEAYLFDEEAKLAYKTQCLPNELCHISTPLKPEKIDPCVTAYLSDDFREFVKNCPFRCATRPPNSDLLISRVQTDKYIFTGKADGVLTDLRNEKNALEKKIKIAAVDEDYFGAIEVTLPCKTKLTVGGKILYSEKPCDDNGTFSEVLLAPWHYAGGRDDDNFDVGLLEHFVNGNTEQRPEHETIIRTIESSSSQAFIWIFFSLVSLILFSIQVFILYQINRLQGGSGPIQNMFFRVRGRDPEPELRLIDG